MQKRGSGPGYFDLSDHCVIDHLEWKRRGEPSPTPLPRRTLWWLSLDRKMHFTGLRGAIWRRLGVHRAVKNPNLCNI